MKFSKMLLLLLLPLLVIPIYAEQSENTIPSWIKTVAGAWANNEITDTDYQNAMVFMIENGIIKVKPVISNQLLDLKNEKILLLEKEIEQIGLDNSHMLLTIVEKNNEIESLQNQNKQITENFDSYKESHSHKVGNIGGATIDENTINQLQETINQLELIVEELEQELRLEKSQ